MLDRETLVRGLQAAVADPPRELQTGDPWEVLCWAILVERSSGERATQILARILEHHVRPGDLGQLHASELEPLLRSTTGRRRKARALVEAARCIHRRWGGSVPVELDQLLRLPGVDRRIAAAVQAEAFGVPAVPVDEHVQRVLHRIGWTAEEDALAAELAVQQELPAQRWHDTARRLAVLGRSICRPKVPRCSVCPLAVDCPRQGVQQQR